MRLQNSAPVRHPPGFIAPCLPTVGRVVPTGAQWVYEIKHDGYRFICRRDGDRVRVFSRRGNDHTDRAPGIVEALLALRVKSVTIDGEGVVCGPDGDSGPRPVARARAKPSSTPSTCWSLTARTCAESHGKRAATHWRASCARRPMASGCASTSTARTVRRCSCTRAVWGWKALSPSGGIGPIGRDGRRTGSRSRTRTHQRR
jgi:hypothetical protein